MGCYLYDPGRRVRCIAAFAVAQRQMNGPDLVTTIHQGDEGFVLSREEPVHTVYVRWDQSNHVTPVLESQLQHLAVIG